MMNVFSVFFFRSNENLIIPSCNEVYGYYEIPAVTRKTLGPLKLVMGGIDYCNKLLKTHFVLGGFGRNISIQDLCGKIEIFINFSYN